MCTIYENVSQLLLYTMIIMASHQMIVTWHKMAVSEGDEVSKLSHGGSSYSERSKQNYL